MESTAEEGKQKRTSEQRNLKQAKVEDTLKPDTGPTADKKEIQRVKEDDKVFCGTLSLS